MSEMRFYSTGGNVRDVSFKEAVFQGLAPDGGLYLPQNFPSLSPDLYMNSQELSFSELSIQLAASIFEAELTPDEVRVVCEDAFNFPTPFLHFPDNLSLLELFHGPSLSFKDYGARFMAALLRLWRQKEEIIVLCATSGDTGSAVGLAFHNIPGIRVFVLFPKGRVTPSQQKQLTGIGGNVKAVEIDGSFEACQSLVREALLDTELQKDGIVTIGNSINVARIFPQALYYFYAYSQLAKPHEEIIVSVPSGNFGHLVSGIFAKRMGLPIHRFLAATNINDEVPLFLQSGIFQPHEAYQTLAVSMDVGNPSNFPRLLELYGGSLEALREDILGFSVTDSQIKEAVLHMYERFGYLLDPHGATAYLALKEYLKITKRVRKGLFFATAHPSKFIESLASIISAPIHIPEQLQVLMNKKSHYINIKPSYKQLKELFFVKI